MKIGILMDAIETITPKKDSSFAIMLAAQQQGHEIRYFQQHDLTVVDGVPWVLSSAIAVTDQSTDYYQLSDSKQHPLATLDVILMRKDPPFDMEYVYATYILEMAEQLGTKVINPPAALRQVNEKFYISYFPEVTPPTLVSKNRAQIEQFISAHGKVVVKPLDGMGGSGIFKLEKDDENIAVILETVSHHFSQTIMVQGFVEGVEKGDKRIILINGEPIDYGLSRIPKAGEFRANLAAGGHGVVEALTEREREICRAVAPQLNSLGLVLVGLDVINGHLTEINITSPTCLREIEKETGIAVAGRLIEALTN